MGHGADRLRGDRGQVVPAEADGGHAGTVGPAARDGLDGQRVQQLPGAFGLAGDAHHPGRLLEVDEQFEAVAPADRQQPGVGRGDVRGRGLGQQRAVHPPAGAVLARLPRLGRGGGVAADEEQLDVLGRRPAGHDVRQRALLRGPLLGQAAQRDVEPVGQRRVGARRDLVVGDGRVRPAPGGECGQQAGQHQAATDQLGRQPAARPAGLGGLAARCVGRGCAAVLRSVVPAVAPPVVAPGAAAGTSGVAGASGVSRRLRLRRGSLHRRLVHAGAAGVGGQPQLPAGQDQVGVEQLAPVGLHAVLVEGEDLLVAQRVLQRPLGDVPEAVVPAAVRRLHRVVLGGLLGLRRRSGLVIGLRGGGPGLVDGGGGAGR